VDKGSYQAVRRVSKGHHVARAWEVPRPRLGLTNVLKWPEIAGSNQAAPRSHSRGLVDLVLGSKGPPEGSLTMLSQLF
jgi:hypothetical protein